MYAESRQTPIPAKQNRKNFLCRFPIHRAAISRGEAMDAEGYPVIDHDLCIECGKCVRTCFDLRQFSEQIWIIEASELTVPLLETYIAKLHQQYAPKTVKRKIASLKALFHHLEYKEIILHNPFAKLQLRFREPIILPKTIPLPKKHDQ